MVKSVWVMGIKMVVLSHLVAPKEIILKILLTMGAGSGRGPGKDGTKEGGTKEKVPATFAAGTPSLLR